MATEIRTRATRRADTDRIVAARKEVQEQIAERDSLTGNPVRRTIPGALANSAPPRKVLRLKRPAPTAAKNRGQTQP